MVLLNPIDYIDQQRDEIIKTYHELHAIAEPSWREEKTSKYILNCLKKAGIKTKIFQGHYGIVAEIPGKTNEVVALRADMDALLQEVDGVVKANHSCGHDAHSTMGLFTALAIASSGIKPKNTIRFIFQPAEEKGEGALQMMKEGVLENVSYLFGVHVRPKVEVPFNQASTVIVHGSAATIKGKIQGVQAHASHPEAGINAIEVAAQLVDKFKQIKIQTEVPYSIKMTQLHTENESTNIIPETAFFSLDARAQTNDVMNQLQLLTQETVDQIIHETGAKITWTLEELVPAAIVNKDAMEITQLAIETILGKENVIPVCISQGGEDFHFYTAKTPGLTATMVGLGCDLAPGLHHPQMKFNLEALIYGTKILTETIVIASDK
ncbi:amidohydrolase [Gottfriedia endophytica]|uniref:amidohydrolase n=1 Tax=Gottfriedia endophytica TaxID=2820819 RepID=UPI002AC320C7|nr:amidohydrolase [Gottfriedia endophytica]